MRSFIARGATASSVARPMWAAPSSRRWGAAPWGRIVHEPCHIVDIMATVLDAAGVPYPAALNGHAITPPEGESLLAALRAAMRGETWTRQQPLFWEHEGNCAMRDGEWKLVRRYPDDWELYNMAEDRTELHDLAARDRARGADGGGVAGMGDALRRAPVAPAEVGVAASRGVALCGRLSKVQRDSEQIPLLEPGGIAGPAFSTNHSGCARWRRSGLTS